MGVCWSNKIKSVSPSITGYNSRSASRDGSSGKASSSSMPTTPRSEGEILQSCNLSSISFTELKNATRNFRPDSVLGEGGFGSVFKGWLDESTLIATKTGSGMVIAVKRLTPEVLTEICEKLEPMIYNKGSYIIRQGEPLDMMFFVTSGIALTYATLGTTIQLRKEKDDLHGDELVTWAEGSSCEMFNLPIYDITVKCHNEVEVFALSASDLQLIVSKYPSEFNTDRTLTIAVENETVN